jgi:phosphatidylglycerophosphate synthase
MTDKEIICSKCKKQITSREELVTTMKFFKIVPYHNRCFSEDLRTRKSFFVSNRPINVSFARTLFAILLITGLIIVYILMLDKKGVLDMIEIKIIVLGIICYVLIWSTIKRILSYYLYESKLK